MPIDLLPAGRPRLAVAIALLALAGCAAPLPAAPPPAVAPEIVPAAIPAPLPVPAGPPAAAASESTVPAPAETVIAYAERLRGLGASELAQEIQRLGDSSYAPARALQLALALGQARGAANFARAQALLQRVLAQPDAGRLHPLARLVSAQLADLRRADEQLERQGQQLREAQRRLDELSDRLEAVRAIERSVPTVPRRDPPVRPVAPAASTRRAR
jgi:hypothetical protein